MKWNKAFRIELLTNRHLVDMCDNRHYAVKGFSKPLTPALEGLVMPFVARCRRCGYIEYALSRWLLNISIEGHDLDSHGDHPLEWLTEKPLTWTVAIVSEADYYMIQRLSKIPKVWEAQRLPKRLLVQVAK